MGKSSNHAALLQLGGGPVGHRQRHAPRHWRTSVRGSTWHKEFEKLPASGHLSPTSSPEVRSHKAHSNPRANSEKAMAKMMDASMDKVLEFKLDAERNQDPKGAAKFEKEYHKLRSESQSLTIQGMKSDGSLRSREEQMQMDEVNEVQEELKDSNGVMYRDQELNQLRSEQNARAEFNDEEGDFIWDYCLGQRDYSDFLGQVQRLREQEFTDTVELELLDKSEQSVRRKLSILRGLAKEMAQENDYVRLMDNHPMHKRARANLKVALYQARLEGLFYKKTQLQLDRLRDEVMVENFPSKDDKELEDRFLEQLKRQRELAEATEEAEDSKIQMQKQLWKIKDEENY